MKIIKEGKLPEEKLLRGTCGYCKCEVEFKQGEATRNSHRNETYYTVTCPTLNCHHSITVEV